MFKAWGRWTVALVIGWSAMLSATVSVAMDGQGVGRFGAVPWTGDPAAAVAASAAGTTIPLGTFKRRSSKDGNLYTVVTVGRSPFAAKKVTTNIQVLVVPLVVQIGTTNFDPTTADACIPGGVTPLAAFLASPLIANVAFDGGVGAGHAALIDGTNGGVTTYLDAFRRAEWWKILGGTAYHTGLKVAVGAPWTITAATVQSLGGGNVFNTGCAPLGVLRTAAFQKYITGTVIPAIPAITPKTFVLFLAKDVVTTNAGALNCLNGCEIGYHGAIGAPVQTFSVAEYDTTSGFWNSPGITDISIVAHEIGEWLDDPLVTNPTPAWGGIGQVSGCQSNWEVGDPLTGTDFPPITMTNAITYDPQELVFHDWYYNARNAGSKGAGGKFSMNGTFSGPSKVCPPGGTY